MIAKKPWTVMVYLAADNNLANFGVNSLQQMKAASSDKINVIAEFDTGPLNKSKRYLFDGKVPFGPLVSNEILEFGPTNAGDSKNLENFIVWTAENYPAEHYFVVVWGHGAGVDDGISQASDNSFIPRHRLLSLFKGILNIPIKGILNIPIKGLSTFSAQEVLGFISDGALAKGFDVIYQDIIDAVNNVVACILAKLRCPEQAATATGFRTRIQAIIDDEIKINAASLKNGPLAALKENVLTALQKGFLDAVQSGTLDQLEREIAAIQSKHGHIDPAGKTIDIPPRDLDRLHDILCDGFLLALQNSMLEAMQMGIFDTSQNGTAVKSLAFVDHPTSFMTNAQLKSALRSAVRKIGTKIDILGMDSCNMNMVEIGYELRDSIGIMVASQDDIPDASWPYDRILAELCQQPDLEPKELASVTAEKYVEAYQDYTDQPVTLSVLNLEFCPEMINLVIKLTEALEIAAKDFKGQQAISNARANVRSFGQNQFVDLIHFCQLLTKGTSNLAVVADKAIAPLEFPFILDNKFSPGEANCNGTSIYFPQSMPAKGSLETLDLYETLDFDKMTGWSGFLRKFLKEITVKTSPCPPQGSRPVNVKPAPVEKDPVKSENAPMKVEKTDGDQRPVTVTDNGQH